MYDIALSVSACLRAGTQVDVAWAIETQGVSSRDQNEALAVTPGGGRIGTVLSGAVNDQLVDLVNQGVTGRAVSLDVNELAAELAGLSCGGSARCLLIRAADLPAGLWQLLRDHVPVCLRTRLDGDRVVNTTMFVAENIADAGDDAARLFRGATTNTMIAEDIVTTVLWPVPKLVVIGAGAIADALRAAAELLGWQAQVITDVRTATGVIAGLAVPDKVVVISHDHDLAGPALAAALAGAAGYIGALGSRHTQQSRADWLAYRGITDLDRIHGPAGLGIGARTPPEIAVSIIAEALAVASGKSASSLRDQSGSIN